EPRPRALRRGRWVVAVDLTLIPYHGRPFRDPAEVYRGQPKGGPTHFHAYATASLVRDGGRFTLALLGVRPGTPPADSSRRGGRLRACALRPRPHLGAAPPPPPGPPPPRSPAPGPPGGGPPPPAAVPACGRSGPATRRAGPPTPGRRATAGGGWRSIGASAA